MKKVFYLKNKQTHWYQTKTNLGRKTNIRARHLKPRSRQLQIIEVRTKVTLTLFPIDSNSFV